MAATAPEIEEYKMMVDKKHNYWVDSKRGSEGSRQKKKNCREIVLWVLVSENVSFSGQPV